MFRFLRGSASQLLIRFWVIFPILGNALPPIYLLSFIVKRDKGAPVKPVLGAFALLCAIYTLYIGARALAAGPLISAVEPTGDAASLLVTAGLAAWACRAPVRLRPDSVYRGLVVMLFSVLFLTLAERTIMGEHRPALLLGNPLNLTPLLLVPAVFCTFTTLAGSRLWAGLGLAGFMLAVIAVGGVSVTRGPLLVLIVLALVRIAFVMVDRKRLASRLTLSGAIMLCLSLGIGISLTNGNTLFRYADMMGFSSSASQQAGSQERRDLTQEKSDAPSSSMEVRTALLKAGWAAFADRPLLGHGPQHRFEAAKPYMTDHPTLRFSHLHNDFLTHAVAGGLPAVGLLCLILISPIVAAWRYDTNRFQRRQIGLLFSMGFAGTAAVNNVLFVDISAFALGLSFVTSFLLLETMRLDQSVDRSGEIHQTGG